MTWYVWKFWWFAWANDTSDGVHEKDNTWRRVCWRLWMLNNSRTALRLEWRLSLCWIGFFWEHNWEYPEGILEANHARIMMKFGIHPREVGMTPRLDVFLCLLPCLPIHLTWLGVAKKQERPKQKRDPESYAAIEAANGDEDL